MLPICSPRSSHHEDELVGGNAEVDHGPVIFVPSKNVTGYDTTEGLWFPELLLCGETITAPTMQAETKVAYVLLELRK